MEFQGESVEPQVEVVVFVEQLQVLQISLAGEVLADTLFLPRRRQLHE
jgi:hypothetical protein